MDLIVGQTYRIRNEPYLEPHARGRKIKIVAVVDGVVSIEFLEGDGEMWAKGERVSCAVDNLEPLGPLGFLESNSLSDFKRKVVAR